MLIQGKIETREYEKDGKKAYATEIVVGFGEAGRRPFGWRGQARADVAGCEQAGRDRYSRRVAP